MIIVDYREQSSGIPKLLEKQNIPFKLENLPVADYIVGNIPIERKDIHDYIESLKDGRLHRQLYELSYNYPFSYLVVIGYISEALLESKFNRRAYISSLVGASLKRAPDGERGQIVTVNLETKYDFVYFLKFLLDKVNNYEPRTPTKPAIKKSWCNSECVVNIISSFPGISETKAKNILSYFGSIRNFSNASVSDMTKVEGIGVKTAKRLYKLLNYKYKF